MKRYFLLMVFAITFFQVRLTKAQNLNIKYQYISFPGGEPNMQLYFKENIKLPIQVTQEGDEGFVEVETQFDEFGKVQHASVLKSVNSAYNDEAIRVINAMPNWNPYINKYKARPITITIRVPFYAERNKSFQYNRALYYYGKQQYHEAYLALKIADYHDSLNIEVYKLIGDVCMKLNQPEVACYYINRGIKLGCEDCKIMKSKSCNTNDGPNVYEKLSRNELDSVDQIAFFGIGEKDIISFISKNTRYPAYERENNIEGKVYASFLVNTDGKILDPYIVRGISPGIDMEVLRVISAFPKFNPAKRRGKLVPIRMNIPVNFKLM